MKKIKDWFSPKTPTWEDIAPPGQKVHFNWQGFSVTSDVRDQCLNGDLDKEVYRWCEEMGVDATIHMKLENNSVWRIRDDEQRVMFVLRWS